MKELDKMAHSVTKFSLECLFIKMKVEMLYPSKLLSRLDLEFDPI